MKSHRLLEKKNNTLWPSAVCPHRGDYIHVHVYVQSVTATTIWSKVWGQRPRCLLPSYRHVKAQRIIFDTNAPCCSSTLTCWKLKHFFCSSGYFTEAVGYASQQCSAFLQGGEKLKGLLAPHLPATTAGKMYQACTPCAIWATPNLHLAPPQGSQTAYDSSSEVFDLLELSLPRSKHLPIPKGRSHQGRGMQK